MRLSASAPHGFIAFSHAGDDWRLCRDHVRARLGIAGDRDEWKCERPPAPRPAKKEDDSHVQAQRLWNQRQPPAGTIAETYLRVARGYGGPTPAMLACLPARGNHAPALIAAFGLADEFDPGLLKIADADVCAVPFVKLRGDGIGKAGSEPNKITIGKSALGVPIVVAPPNDRPRDHRRDRRRAFGA